MRNRRLPECSLVAGLILLWIGGCGSGSGALTAGPGESAPAPLAGGGSASNDADQQDPPPDIEAILTANAEALKDLQTLPIERREPKVDTNTDEQTPAVDQVAASIERTPVVVEREDEPAAHAIEPTREPTRAERIERLTKELATLLRAEADASDSPVSAMAKLDALEMIERGVAPDPASMPWLTVRERELLVAFRDLFREAGERLASDPNDLLSVQRVIEGLPDRLESWRALSIPTAALCVRVDGFGQYEEFRSNTLLAGRTHRMIVYTELADFRSEPGTGPSGEIGRRVRLRQDLSLYHDADGLLAWRKADQPIDEFSRNERRDFFLVQLIELPQTLTVGSYRLKVTVVDEVAGATAEAVIPIDVVADSGLAGR
ncbi:MAG: hypothetical protein H6813_04525 [Phycisphaeraceae bacterium]|nr:hypothetical protein [Phycisphaeraceae bacterium]MCB9847214.1 hypothetical protein [Phycisphaeraceae bacterium]